SMARSAMSGRSRPGGPAMPRRAARSSRTAWTPTITPRNGTMRRCRMRSSDLEGHAIHGFFDVKHLGSAVSHGCVRLSPDHAQTLFKLVKAQGMSETKVVVAGRTPGGDNGPVARSRLPINETVSSEPTDISPGYGRAPSSSYGQSTYGQS